MLQLSCAIVLQARKRERVQLLGKHVQWVRCTRGTHVNVCARARVVLFAVMLLLERVWARCAGLQVKCAPSFWRCSARASTRCTAETLTCRTV